MRLIDAESLSSMRFTHEMHDSEGRLYVPFDEVAEAIFNAPTIEAEPVRKGRWVPVTNGRGGFECSICHSYAPSYQDGVEWLSLYCPNCGAKMDAEEGEKE